MTDRLYTRRGAGAQRGTSWRDARGLMQLRADLREGRPGDRFMLGFSCGGEDALVWSENLTEVRVSGAPGRPIRIEAGCTADAAVLRLMRGSGPRFFQSPDAMRHGRQAAIRMVNGASFLSFAGFRLDGAPADGFFKFAQGAHDGIAIRTISARSAGRVIESGEDAVLRNMLVEDCDAARLSRGFARFHNIESSVIRNLVLDAENVDLGGGNVTQLIAVTRGRDVRFENIEMRNAVNVRDYVQGDGLVLEGATQRMQIKNCRASGMGDGGFDLKTVDFTMEDCQASGCKYGVRIWARGTLRRVQVREPRQFGRHAGACIQASGRAELIDCQLQAGQGAAAFKFDAREQTGAPHIRMHGGAIRLDGGARLVTGDAAGVLELDSVTVNGALRSGRFTSSNGAS